MRWGFGVCLGVGVCVGDDGNLHLAAVNCSVQRRTPAIPKFTRHAVISRNLVGFSAYQAVHGYGSHQLSWQLPRIQSCSHLIATSDSQHPTIKSLEFKPRAIQSPKQRFKTRPPTLYLSRQPCPSLLAYELHMLHHCLELGVRAWHRWRVALRLTSVGLVEQGKSPGSCCG